MPLSARRDETEWLQTVADALRSRANAIAEDVGDELVKRGLAGEELAPVERNSLIANIVGIADTLEFGARVSTPPPALRASRRGAQLGMDDRTLALIYYVGQSAIWTRHLLPLVVETTEDPADLLQRCTRVHQLLSDYLEGVEHEVTERLRTERMLLGAPLTDAEIITGMLGGTDPGATVGSYPLARTHIAVSCWTTGSSDDAVGRLKRATAIVLRSAPPGPRLRYEPSRHHTTVWFAADRPAQARSLFESLRKLRLDGQELWAAIGEPADGVEGFRRTYEETEIVRSFLLMRGSAALPSITPFRDLAYPATLLADRGLVQRFARLRLGPLSEPEHRKLRDTVFEYLRNDGSFARTAAILGVHRNTVYQRVRKVESLIGNLSGSLAFELYAALLVQRYLDESTA